MLAKLDYILKRLVMSALVLLGLSVITFILARVVPSDPAALYIGPRARPEQIEAITIKLGLDKPLYVQYLYYLRDALHGDLQKSIATKRPVVRSVTIWKPLPTGCYGAATSPPSPTTSAPPAATAPPRSPTSTAGGGVAPGPRRQTSNR